MALTFLPLEESWIESGNSDLVEVGTLGNRELVVGWENWLPERPRGIYSSRRGILFLCTQFPRGICFLKFLNPFLKKVRKGLNI